MEQVKTEIIDNFDKISALLTFENENTLYSIQIFKRRKDNPDLEKHTKKIRSYYIRNISEYEKCKPSIIRECEQNNARAYIDLNSKDIEKIALYALKKTADHIYNREYHAVRNVYDDAVGNSSCIGRKLWLVDIDVNDQNVVDKVYLALEELESEIKLVLRTKNGFHIICTPFNLRKFVPVLEEIASVKIFNTEESASVNPFRKIDVIKHGMTLLYCL